MNLFLAEKFMKATSFYVGFKMIKSVIHLYLLPMLGEGTFLAASLAVGAMSLSLVRRQGVSKGLLVGLK